MLTEPVPVGFEVVAFALIEIMPEADETDTEPEPVGPADEDVVLL